MPTADWPQVPQHVAGYDQLNHDVTNSTPYKPHFHSHVSPVTGHKQAKVLSRTLAARSCAWPKPPNVCSHPQVNAADMNIVLSHGNHTSVPST